MRLVEVQGVERARGAERAARKSATLWSASARSPAAGASPLPHNMPPLGAPAPYSIGGNGVTAEAKAGNSPRLHHRKAFEQGNRLFQ